MFSFFFVLSKAFEIATHLLRSVSRGLLRPKSFQWAKLTGHSLVTATWTTSAMRTKAKV